mmetsp:Transcript_7094/g.10366  ORF Transcript_7094/g.10366 Transcript_7094/m.10366 type:complete len:209 (+) Transcript_7094:663-1289(+)
MLHGPIDFFQTRWRCCRSQSGVHITRSERRRSHGHGSRGRGKGRRSWCKRGWGGRRCDRNRITSHSLRCHRPRSQTRRVTSPRRRSKHRSGRLPIPDCQWSILARRQQRDLRRLEFLQPSRRLKLVLLCKFLQSIRNLIQGSKVGGFVFGHGCIELSNLDQDGVQIFPASLGHFVKQNAHIRRKLVVLFLGLHQLGFVSAQLFLRICR